MPVVKSPISTQPVSRPAVTHRFTAPKVRELRCHGAPADSTRD